jgi:hypothetical protein
MRTLATPRHAERGQTLPIWTLAVTTALTLMFFSLNYANVIRWQVRAQNAADAAAMAGLSVQATQWNKMTTLLYAADVEEWRIRHLLEGMINASAGNGGCTGGSYTGTGSCLSIYNALQQQYYKAVNRYTTDIQMLQSMGSIGATSQSSDATSIIHSFALACSTTNPVVDCAFTYHIVNYGYRLTTEQAGKDAFYVQLGGFSSPQDSTPAADWEPAKIEIATCATVQPIVNFSLFGKAPASSVVIGRAAATNVTETSEWFVPGVQQNPATGVAYQTAENYDPTDDTFAGTASPRDWYETNYPSMSYQDYGKPINNYNGGVADDFEIMECWWGAIPFAPYSGTQPQATLCTQS